MRVTGPSICTQLSGGKSHILGELGSDLGRSQTTEKNVLDQLLQDPLLWATVGTIQTHQQKARPASILRLLSGSPSK